MAEFHSLYGDIYDPIFQGKKLVKYITKYAYIDKELYFKHLCEVYGKIIDSSYKSTIQDKTAFTYDLIDQNPHRSLTQDIMLRESTNMIIVGHWGPPFIYFMQYITQSKKPLIRKNDADTNMKLGRAVNFVAQFKRKLINGH